LTVRTIKQCVSSHQWLKEGFKANGDFELAQAIVSTQLTEDIQESKPKKAIIGDNSSWPLAIE
jgi:hypothetical protein